MFDYDLGMLPEKDVFSQMNEKSGRVDLPPLRSKNVWSIACLIMRQ
jgi:hypothetical protein